MDPEHAWERREKVQLLDIREDWEWRAGHIDSSLHIPMTGLSQRQDEIAEDRLVVCVCRSGNRSAMVARALARAGYDAENLDGGVKAWKASGFPLVTPDGKPGEVA